MTAAPENNRADTAPQMANMNFIVVNSIEILCFL